MPDLRSHFLRPSENRDLTPGVAVAAVLFVLVLLTAIPSAAQDPDQQPGPVFNELILDNATVFSRDDVIWLLRLRPGERLPGPPERVAELLQRRYARDGYTAATVTASFDDATKTLTLRVDEGRVDDVQFEGLPARLVERFRERLGVSPGDIYNETEVRESLDHLLSESAGALRTVERGPELVQRDTRRVLVIPIEQRKAAVNFGLNSLEREDFFNPVDGFSPAVSLGITRFDPAGFRHTFIGAHFSYKFSSEEVGYSLGIEQPIFASPKLFVGGAVHDITTSDDLWRLSNFEQSIVALTFHNTFRHYYRRHGGEIVGGARFGRANEIMASMRWDRHESLVNETDYSFFRDDHEFPPNPPIEGGDVHALVLAYTFDTRGVDSGTPGDAFRHHRLEDLYDSNRREAPGIRVSFTNEFAGGGLGGDFEFNRHIINSGTYLALGNRQFLGARALFGFSGGTLPIERRFALGGIGSVHGYAFKESVGEQMALFNLEYRLEITRGWRGDSKHGILALLAFYDAGRVGDPIGGSRSDWLQGTGFGLQSGPVRVEFGFRANDIPDSRQILVRINPTF
jgi:outer membrane protein insertion porin family